MFAPLSSWQATYMSDIYKVIAFVEKNMSSLFMQSGQNVVMEV